MHQRSNSFTPPSVTATRLAVGLSVALTFAMALAPSSAHAGADAGTDSAGWSLEDPPRVTFVATGPAGFKIEGKAEKLSLTQSDGQLRFSVALADLDTGIGLRNRHMLEDLEAEKHPTVSLVLPAALVQLPSGDQPLEGTAPGRWTLHGATREVPVRYRGRCQAGSCDVQADATLDLNEFGVKIRSYLGITVKKVVPVNASLRLRRR